MPPPGKHFLDVDDAQNKVINFANVDHDVPDRAG